MTDGELVDFDLAIRSRIEIAAPPEAVWSALERLRDWKASVVSYERLAGEAGQVGELLRIGQRPLDVTVHTLMRTLRAERAAWKVQTLQTEDGRATDGYVTYTLDPVAGATRLSCEVVARCRIPAPDGDGAMRGASPAEIARAANASTLAKLDADHLVLKRLVETGRP